MPNPTPPYGLTVTVNGVNNDIAGYAGDTYSGGIYLYYSTDDSTYTVFRHITQTFSAGDPFSYADGPIADNIRYYYRAVGLSDLGPTLPSDSCNVARWTDEITVYFSASGTVSSATAMGDVCSGAMGVYGGTTEAADLHDTVSATMGISGTPDSSQSIKTNYAHYLGDITGKVYTFAPTLLSFNGASINSYWTSKVTDFSELDLSLFGKWKSIYWVKVKYVDKAASTPVILSISVDNGTWTPLTQQYIGIGDNGFKDAYFYTVKTGKYFQFKVEWPSTDKTFQFTGLEVALTSGGEEFKTI